MADDINVTPNILYLYVANLIPSPEIQVMFNEATKKNYKISFDEWYTERRVKSDMITQLDIGTSQHVNSPKYLIGAHQKVLGQILPTKIMILRYLIISIFKKIMLKSIR